MQSDSHCDSFLFPLLYYSAIINNYDQHNLIEITARKSAYEIQHSIVLCYPLKDLFYLSNLDQI